MKWLTFLPVKLKKRKQKYNIRYKLDALTHTHRQSVPELIYNQLLSKGKHRRGKYTHSLLRKKHNWKGEGVHY